MKTLLLSCSLLAVVTVVVGATRGRGAPAAVELPPRLATPAESTAALGRLPVAFVPNLGQWEPDARYVAKVGAMTVFLEDKGWSFTLVEPRKQGKKESREPRCRQSEPPAARGVGVRMTFANANAPELRAEHQLPGRHNYFLGNDAAKWRSDVPLFGSVRYHGMHDGVDVRAREHGGYFEYDLLLAPGADLEPVEIVVEGADRLHVAADGALVMTTTLGPVRMPVPTSWEEGPAGEQTPVVCRYELRGANRFGFVVPARRSGWALVVDPGLVWSTFLGGSDWDQAEGVAVDAQGQPTVIGSTRSINYPTTPGAFDTSINSTSTGDAFITRISADGTALVYSTFLGGSNHDYTSGIALDAQGVAVIAGYTQSTNLPTTPGAFDSSHNNLWDAFVAKISASGSSLLFCTYLGTTGQDSATAVALDAAGDVTVVGATNSASFPVTPGAYDVTHNGSNDAFVAKLTAAGTSLVYSTFLGGAAWDLALALAVDPQGLATVGGRTESVAFPTTPGAFDNTYNGGIDGFVAQLSPNGANLLFSTFLGDTGEDVVQDLVLAPLGTVVVTGETDSISFPTTPGAFDTSHSGGTDAFITKLSPSGYSLVYSTFLGGSRAQTLALDAQGGAVVAGNLDGVGFPTTPGALLSTAPGGFLSRLSPDGSRLFYSALLGDVVGAMSLGTTGEATVVSLTGNPAFPSTPGAFQSSYNGGFSDATVSRLDMLPTGVSAFGASSPGCSGPLAMSVTSMPRVGNTAFSFTCGNAAPNTPGLIAFASSRLLTPVPLLGVDIWIDPTTLLASATVTSTTIGAIEVPLPIPNNPAFAGLHLFTQFLWLGPASPQPCPATGFSTSNALDFTIQP